MTGYPPTDAGAVVAIDLRHGCIAFVDAVDAHLAALAWNRKVVGRKGFTKHIYASRNFRVNGKPITEYLHRVVAGAKSGDIVDHIDGDTLNNRRSNLRIVTASENAENRRATKLNSRTGIVGVSLKSDGAYVAQLTRNRQLVFLKRFKTLEEASAALTEAHRRWPSSTPEAGCRA